MAMRNWKHSDVNESFHGVQVADPFRWLEDSTSADTRAFVSAQNEHTHTYLRSLPHRADIRARLEALWNYPKNFVPERAGNRYFFLKNDGLQNQPVLYVQDGRDGEPRVLLNPNTLSENGTVALSNATYSRDGSRMAYAVSTSGSDRQEVRVLDVDGEVSFADHILWSKFTPLSWTMDGAGFFYSRYPTPGTVSMEDENHYSQVYYHRIGTAQSADQLIFERREEKSLHFSPIVSDDGKYLFIYAGQGTDPRNRLYTVDLTQTAWEVRTFIATADASYHVVGSQGTELFIHTDLDAPRGRIVKASVGAAPATWTTIVAEHEDVIAEVSFIASRLVVLYKHNAYHRLQLFDRDGHAEKEVALPSIGSITGITGHAEDDEMFFSFTSYLFPTTIYRYDFTTGRCTIFRETTIAFDASQYETKQVFFTSKDGTRVPMFVSHKKGLALDGRHPALLYGYGGFNISLTPALSVSALVWMEAGGVYVVANLRGGDEYGEAWHQAGMLHHKQNVFDDFISAGEALIALGYTNNKHLAIMGGSNGGLLVGACMLQRPDLFGAVICMVPVTDMLRYHRFTVGHYWIPEYGNAEQNADDFHTVMQYSPLHNVKPGMQVPPVLITTADTDDRVVPAHAMKFAATLQTQADSSAQVYLRVETQAGHGAGKPTSKVIDEQTDIFAFLYDVFEMTK